MTLSSMFGRAKMKTLNFILLLLFLFFVLNFPHSIIDIRRENGRLNYDVITNQTFPVFARCQCGGHSAVFIFHVSESACNSSAILPPLFAEEGKWQPEEALIARIIQFP
jgi:hypothetical protein